MKKSWSTVTKLLHLGMATAIVLQLLISLVMEFPDSEKETNTLSASFFEMHEVVGTIAIVFVLLHWLWLFKATDNHFSTLFPWSKSGRSKIVSDLKQLKSGQQLQGGPGSGGLVGFIHGLGFLAASGMVLTGLVLLIMMPEAGNKLSSGAHTVAEVHESLSVFIWIYVIAHVAMAYRHHLSGHSELKDMFSFRKS